MKCPVCQNETDASARFCEFCGNELDRDFDHLAGELVRETEEEKTQKMEEEIRGILVLVVFLFLVTWTVYAIIPATPDADVAPSYIPKAKESDLKAEVPLLEPEMPE